MERASSGSDSPPNSSESLNGLKFGKKIYFEDVGIGVPLKSSGGSSSVAGSGNPSSSKVPAKKVKSSSGSGVIQIPRCQVEGCKVDLSDSKAYYSRHKVCGMHSKSPKVIVSGLEQRFCQQCSRFHQLPEFDQGKRSCRRRLAGHNERRRKPPPGSIPPSHYGRLSSSVFGLTIVNISLITKFVSSLFWFCRKTVVTNSSNIMTENNGHGGGFLLDFSSHQRLPERDLWPTARSPDQVTGNQTTATGKFLSSPWENNNDNPPSNTLFLQGSSNATGFPGPSFPAGDFFAGVSDSGCALSLLSNQPWSGSRPRASDLEVSNFVHTEGAPFGHSPAPQVAPINHFPTPSWPFKENDVSGISHSMVPDQGLVQMSQPHNGQFSCEFESSSQRSGRQYMELEHHPRADYSSPTHHVHWSL